MIDRKILRRGTGFRLVDPEYSRTWGGWQTGTVVVRVPGVRNRTFRTSLIATQGIQGQSQLTFDSRQAAHDWLAAHPQYSDCLVGEIRGQYDCVKIPLEDGSEGYLCISLLHPDTDYWRWLEELYPDYFMDRPRLRAGWFTENLNETVYTRPNIHLEEAGWFNESIDGMSDNEYCKQKFGKSWDIIKKMSFKSLCSQSEEEYEDLPWTDEGECPDGDSYFVAPTFDSCGVREFQTLEQCFDYWGREVVENFIPRLIQYWVSKGFDESPKAGWFHEGYRNLDPEKVKQLVFFYVRQNGYIRGGWNGRYPTESPTVVEINNIIRSNQYESYLPVETDEYRKWEEFKTWADQITPDPNDPTNEWLARAKGSWNKTAEMDKTDVKNLVSFSSYFLSQQAYERRQQVRQERERQHQAEVESEANTWAGQIGDEVTFTIASVETREGPYGIFYTGKGTDGRSYSWTQPDSVKQPEVTDVVTGKVKKLNEFRGIKTTHLVRIRIVRGTPHAGWFN